MPRGGFNNGPIRHARVCRTVWRAVSDAPQMTVRRLSARTGLSTSTINRALHTLRDVYGYIDFPDKATNARRVLYPFYIKEFR
jgi:DNA-binding MurR/RpiR family transcriptional regulator